VRASWSVRRIKAAGGFASRWFWSIGRFGIRQTDDATGGQAIDAAIRHQAHSPVGFETCQAV
jgi:hypothetical protein